MKTSDYIGQEIERLQMDAMRHLRVFDELEAAKKVSELSAGLTAAKAFLDLEDKWKKEVEHLTQPFLSNVASLRSSSAWDTYIGQSSAADALRNSSETSAIVAAVFALDPTMKSYASRISDEFDGAKQKMRDQLGLSAAQTLASTLHDARNSGSLSAYASATALQGVSLDAMALSAGLRGSFSIAQAAGITGIEKAIANAIEGLSAQYVGQFDVTGRVREMMGGLSAFDLATTASLARFHGVEGIARQMAALGLEPSDYFDDDDLESATENAAERPLERSASTWQAPSLDVLGQLLINLIAAYIWAMFLASTVPNPDADTQSKKIARVELMIEKLPQLVEAQVANIIRQHLFSMDTYFVVKERTAKLRSSPQGSVIALAFPNQKVKLIEERGKWIKIEFYDYLNDAVQQGWVLKKYCIRVPNSAAGRDDATRRIEEFRGSGQGGSVERLIADREADRERDK